MLDQEDDTEFDSEWLTAYRRLTCFSKSRKKIMGRVKGAESPSVKVPQYYEESLVLRERVLRRTERPSVRQPGTYGNHAPIGQSQNDGYSDSQEIPVPMDDVHPEGNGYQSITSTSGEDLGRNVHARRSERIRKYPQRYNPGFGAASVYATNVIN